MGWIEAVGQLFRFLANFMQGVLLFLPDLITLIHSWVEYWQAKNKRIKDAVADEVAAKLKAADSASRKAQANLKASMMIYDEIWKDTYVQFLEHLKSDKPENCLFMVKKQNFVAASIILFDMQETNEVKAQLLTDIIRNAS